MTDVVANVGRARSEGNLVSGFKGSRLIVEVEGLQQTAALLARVTNVEFRKNINAFHGRQIGILSQRARDYFEESVSRPNESGARSHARQTGKFGFGQRSGGAFVGVTINEPELDQYGFGYPDIARADRVTNYVWRSLEFGLKPHPGAVRDQFAPIGVHKFPSSFTFLPFSGPGGVFTPRGKGSGPTGTLVTPRGRVVRRVKAPGWPARLFITRAFNDVAANITDGYQTVVAETYKDFK